MLRENILAVDTSTTSCSILLLLDGERYHYAVHGQAAHAEQFYQWLNELHQLHPNLFERLTCLGLCIGPGRFNGLRVGMTLISTLMALYELPAHVCTAHQLLSTQSTVRDSLGYAIFAKFGYAYWTDGLDWYNTSLIPFAEIPERSVVFGIDQVAALEHHVELDIAGIEQLIINNKTSLKQSYHELELLYTANMA